MLNISRVIYVLVETRLLSKYKRVNVVGKGHLIIILTCITIYKPTVLSCALIHRSLIGVLPKQLLNDNELRQIGVHFPHRLLARGPSRRTDIGNNDEYTRKLSLLRRYRSKGYFSLFGDTFINYQIVPECFVLVIVLLTVPRQYIRISVSTKLYISICTSDLY